MRYYGGWAGNERGVPEDPKRCVASVPRRGTILFKQCDHSRRTDDDLCLQHWRMRHGGLHVSVPEHETIIIARVINANLKLFNDISSYKVGQLVKLGYDDWIVTWVDRDAVWGSLNPESRSKFEERVEALLRTINAAMQAIATHLDSVAKPPSSTKRDADGYDAWGYDANGKDRDGSYFEKYFDEYSNRYGFSLKYEEFDEAMHRVAEALANRHASKRGVRSIVSAAGFYGVKGAALADAAIRRLSEIGLACVDSRGDVRLVSKVEA